MKPAKTAKTTKPPRPPAASFEKFYCQCCSQRMTNEEQFQNHNRNIKHIKKAQAGASTARAQSESVRPRTVQEVGSVEKLPSTEHGTTHFVDLFCVCGVEFVSARHIYRINDGNVWTNHPELANLVIETAKRRNNGKTVEMIEIGLPVVIYMQQLKCIGCSANVGQHMEHHRSLRGDLVQYKFYPTYDEKPVCVWKGSPEYHTLSSEHLEPKTKVEEAVLKWLEREGSITRSDIQKLDLRNNEQIKVTSWIPLYVFHPDLIGDTASEAKLKRTESYHKMVRDVYLEESNLKVSSEWRKSPRFQFLLQVLDRYTNADKKFMTFLKQFKDEYDRNAKTYRARCNDAHDKIVKWTKSSPAFKQLIEEPVADQAWKISHRLGAQTLCPNNIPPSFELQRNELYLEEHADWDFVSVDIKSANYNILRLLGLFQQETWSEFVAKVSGTTLVNKNSLVAKSKKLRVRVLGKFFHEKVRALEFHVVRLVANAIRTYGIKCAEIFCFSCDELLLKVHPGEGRRVCAEVQSALSRFPLLDSLSRVTSFHMTVVAYTPTMQRELEEINSTPGEGDFSEKSSSVVEAEVEPEWRVDDSQLPPKPLNKFFVKKHIVRESESDPEYSFKHVPMCIATLAHVAFHKVNRI